MELGVRFPVREIKYFFFAFFNADYDCGEGRMCGNEVFIEVGYILMDLKYLLVGEDRRGLNTN